MHMTRPDPWTKLELTRNRLDRGNLIGSNQSAWNSRLNRFSQTDGVRTWSRQTRSTRPDFSASTTRLWTRLADEVSGCVLASSVALFLKIKERTELKIELACDTTRVRSTSSGKCWWKRHKSCARVCWCVPARACEWHSNFPILSPRAQVTSGGNPDGF